jgi:hypothetical protein
LPLVFLSPLRCDADEIVRAVLVAADSAVCDIAGEIKGMPGTAAVFWTCMYHEQAAVPIPIDAVEAGVTPANFTFPLLG